MTAQVFGRIGARGGGVLAHLFGEGAVHPTPDTLHRERTVAFFPPLETKRFGQCCRSELSGLCVAPLTIVRLEGVNVAILAPVTWKSFGRPAILFLYYFGIRPQPVASRAD